MGDQIADVVTQGRMQPVDCAGNIHEGGGMTLFQ
jgi:hypothetical protein